MNPKRRFFQIHLSTAVVLMFVAGVLVWANVREQKDANRQLSEFYLDEHPWNMHGWPFYSRVCQKYAQFRRRSELGGIEIYFVDDIDWFPIHIIFNALIALAILLSVCVACEWRIRRREARKAND